MRGRAGRQAMISKKLLNRYRINDARRFRLMDVDPADTGGLNLDKSEAKDLLAADSKRLGELHERLYVDNRWAVLVVLQGMDTAGKDGVIKHVMGGLNPQGCVVHPFKPPSEQELEHDFLWRAALRLPERGHVAIFNRSHYEEVLVVRVHPEYLQRQHLPDELIGGAVWKQRFKSIRAFERHLARNGTLVLKFFLHISKEEQRRRLLARLDEPDKRWKFNPGDIAERKLWDKYMAAYEDAIRQTSRDGAPWHVVPADSKPFARLVVARAMVEALSRLDLKMPKVDSKALKEMEAIKKNLIGDAQQIPPTQGPRPKRK
jgi:PPK2 family polyphosphate:nucleotide phosphotransferase